MSKLSKTKKKKYKEKSLAHFRKGVNDDEKFNPDEFTE